MIFDNLDELDNIINSSEIEVPELETYDEFINWLESNQTIENMD